MIAFYFTVATISTIGYGDISGTNDYERGTCCVLMVLGVTFFSIASGTFTNLIQNYDEESQKFNERKEILDKIL